MKLIITGATGNAGSGILAAALASPQITQVTLLSRRPVPTSHPKLSTILLPSAEHPSGFDACPTDLVEKLRGHTGVIWALGISQTQVSKEEYVKITHDYTMSFVKGLSTLGTPSQPFKFIFISGEGADQSEKARTLFGNVKGRTEKEIRLAETEGFKTVSVRPGGIIPTAEHRPHMSFLMRTGLPALGAVFRAVYPSMFINSADLGTATVRMATSDWGWDLKTEEGWIGNGRLVAALAAAKHAQQDI